MTRPRSTPCPQRRRRRTAAAALAALALLLLPRTAPLEAAPTTEAFDAMCTDVAAVAGADPAVTTGVVVLDLETGARCAINGGRIYRSASLYKTVVAAELWRRVEEGTLSLDEEITVEPRHHLDDPESVRPRAPYTISIREAASRMITRSDNGTATALWELLGEDAMAASPGWLGMGSTSVVGEYATSPNDQATLFAALYRREVVSEAASDAILDLLLRQEVVDLIPAALPHDAPPEETPPEETPPEEARHGTTRIAHKTGALDTFLHDAGIVYAPGGDFVLVVMTENTDYHLAAAVIQDVAATAYEAYATPSPGATPPPGAPATPGAPVTSGAPVTLSAPLAPLAPAVPTSGAAPIISATTSMIVDPTKAPPAAVLVGPDALRPANEATSDRSASRFTETMQQPVVLGGVLALAAAVALLRMILVRRGTNPSSTRDDWG